MSAYSRFELIETGAVTCVAIGGEVDLSNAQEVALKLFDAVGAESLGFVLDVSDVRYMDSSGISILFELSRTLSARRQWMALVMPPGSPIRPLVELTKLRLAVAVRDTLEDAKQAALETLPELEY